MNLPFGDGSFDCVTIAFGLRNLENCAAALGEMSRVIKSNGHLLVLEFSLPTTPILRALYRFYLHRCLPLLRFFLNRRRKCLRLSWRFDRGISKWRCNVSADGGERFHVPDVQTAHWWNRHDLYGHEAVTAERSGRAIPILQQFRNYSELALQPLASSAWDWEMQLLLLRRSVARWLGWPLAISKCSSPNC